MLVENIYFYSHYICFSADRSSFIFYPVALWVIVSLNARDKTEKFSFCYYSSGKYVKYQRISKKNDQHVM